MKTLASLATLVVALLAARAQAIDFTPRFSDSVEDGISMRRMYFFDGGQRIFYRPPVDWSQFGDAEAATFSPKDSNQAMVKITNAPAEQAHIAFDGPGLEALRKIAATLLPPDATKASEIWEVVNPVVFQDWTSFEMGFDYVQFGQRFCRSILFINLDPNRQIHFIVSAPPAEFKPLYQTAYRTFPTWYQSTTATP